MSATGLNAYQRARSRRRAVTSARLALAHAPSVHYTQGVARWEGINEHRRAYRGEYPHHADCSAFTTWCLWDATLRYHPHDFVNGEHWQAGYTGTQQAHGRRLGVHEKKLPGDLVFYGNQGGGIAEHVAIYVGDGKVISHGSEGGPFLLAWNYRPVNETRRYIR